jgi:DNA primase
MRLIDSKRVETSILSEINATISKPAEFIEFDSAMIDNLHNNLRENPEARNYLINRGITIESMQRYKIGYSLKRIMITIPIHAPDGMCVGFVGRSIEGKEFSNSHGLPRSKTLFNIHRTKISSQIFVVESSFDAMRIEQVGRAAVATLGSTVSNKQMSLLKQYFNSIILLPDNDEAGRSMTKKMQESLGNSVVIGNIPKEYKDISDMNDSELTSLIYRFDNMVEYIFN